jgi:hypothetical protein
LVVAAVMQASSSRSVIDGRDNLVWRWRFVLGSAN